MPTINCENANGSYAEAATRRSAPTRPVNHANIVSINSGKSFSIANVDRVIIGLMQNNTANFPSCKETEAALRRVVDPVKLKISVQRTSFGPSSTVCVEGSALDALRECPDLATVGLEIKTKSKMNPRLVVHDIPAELDSDYIVNSIVEQNVPDAAPGDVKLVYQYPVRDGKKHRSCVIETMPALRSRLLNRQKITIGWSACRVNDHVTILQCYKCQRFGHLANNCAGRACCGHCAGEHATKECRTRNALRCTNCDSAKGSNINHAATDRARCPILRRKIEQKISLIDYGDQ